MTIQTNATIQPPAADTAARAQEIRRRLPGQARRQRLDTARLEYGPLYSLAEIQQRVAQTLHQKVGFIRRAVFEPIESYRDPFPLRRCSSTTLPSRAACSRRSAW